MSQSITTTITFDLGQEFRAMHHYINDGIRTIVAARESELERFAISGAMPRDLCIVVSPFVAHTPGAPAARRFQQAWRVN